MPGVVKAQAAKTLLARPAGKGAGLGARHLRPEARQPDDARRCRAVAGRAQIRDAPLAGCRAHNHELRLMIVHPMKPCRRGKRPRVMRDRPTILQIVPHLDAGGAELSAVEITEALVRAGGRALLLAEPGGRLIARVAAAGGEPIPFPAAAKNPIRMLVNAQA